MREPQLFEQPLLALDAAVSEGDRRASNFRASRRRRQVAGSRASPPSPLPPLPAGLTPIWLTDKFRAVLQDSPTKPLTPPTAPFGLLGFEGRAVHLVSRVDPSSVDPSNLWDVKTVVERCRGTISVKGVH